MSDIILRIKENPLDNNEIFKKSVTEDEYNQIVNLCNYKFYNPCFFTTHRKNIGSYGKDLFIPFTSRMIAKTQNVALKALFSLCVFFDFLLAPLRLLAFPFTYRIQEEHPLIRNYLEKNFSKQSLEDIKNKYNHLYVFFSKDKCPNYTVRTVNFDSSWDHVEVKVDHGERKWDDTYESTDRTLAFKLCVENHLSDFIFNNLFEKVRDFKTHSGFNHR